MTQLTLRVATRLREYREARGLTQDQLAEATGVAKSSVGKYEREELRITVDYIEKFCKAVTIHPLELFEPDAEKQ